MKVIFANRYFLPDESATSQMMSGVALDIVQRGWPVTVITSRQRYADAKAVWPSRQTVGGLQIHRVWTTQHGRARLAGRMIDYVSFYIMAIVRLLIVARTGDLLVIGTDPPLFSVLAGVAAALRRSKLINWLHDLFPEVALELGVIEPGPAAALLRRLRDHSLRRAMLNVVPGERMACYLRRIGVPTDRIALIHNWSDGHAVRPIEHANNALRLEWGLGDRFVVGYSGNLGRAHEFSTILESADRLRGRDDILFLFIGGGYHESWIVVEARRLGLTNILMKPLQPTERLGESLAVADVHLVSLRPELEGFVVPSKFYGIAAAGRPTLFIGDPDGEIPRILAEADCGATVSIGDASALAEHIIRLEASEALRRRWGSNARSKFDHCFERRLAIDAWLRIIESAVGSGLAPALREAR
jgi:colanic acid biosynthesis glycosyl transferase WcaI